MSTHGRSVPTCTARVRVVCRCRGASSHLTSHTAAIIDPMACTHTNRTEHGASASVSPSHKHAVATPLPSACARSSSHAHRDWHPTSVSHDIYLCLVYCGPSVTCLSHTPVTTPQSTLMCAAPFRAAIPDALSYFRMDFHLTSPPFQMAMGRARQRAVNEAESFFSPSLARESQRTAAAAVRLRAG